MSQFNFCSVQWGSGCPDYPEDDGAHLCGENYHERHVHRCSCGAKWDSGTAS